MGEGDYICHIRIMATALNIWEKIIYLYFNIAIRIKYINQICIVATALNTWDK